MTQTTTFAVVQECETPAQTCGDGSTFIWRYAYGRSADLRQADSLGQDYLAVQSNDVSFAFAVCDGVGESFCGDLASRILADALVAWLWKELPLSDDPDAISKVMAKYLGDLTKAASEQVRTYPLPDNLSRILREVLEEKREDGSQSTFVCGRIDRPSKRFPDGRAVFAWLGDTRLRLWGPEGERSAELGETFHTMERWSTRLGPVGSKRVPIAPHVHVMPLSQHGLPSMIRCMAYSDGLKLLDPFQEPLSDEEVNDLIASASESPTSDDISFLELCAIAMESVPLPPPSPQSMAAPVGLLAHPMADRLRATWQPITDVTGYQVEIMRDGVWIWRVLTIDGRTWESWPLPPGSYALRVRAMVDGQPGKWTAAHDIQLASQTFRKLAGLVGLLVMCSTLALLTGMFLQAQSAKSGIPKELTGTPLLQTPMATHTPTVTPTPTTKVTATVLP